MHYRVVNSDDLVAELSAFMRKYEEANNSHDIERVAPMIAADATYWFTDGSHHGRARVLRAIEETFAVIRDEVYTIGNVAWIVLTSEHAACRYEFSWAGIVHGEPRSGRGRGTNVLARTEGRWQITHEHLST